MPTWSEIKTEIQIEQDLSEETWISDIELLNFANDGIADIEKEIHTIHDKYFDADASISLVQGQSEYDLPSDIYANKITSIFYNNGSDKYEIKELKTLSDVMFIEDNDEYQYRIINTSTGGRKLKIYPAARETDSTSTTMSYRRNAKPFTLDADELDIPEAKDFIKQYVKDKVSNKERMTPDAPESAALSRKRKALLDSLENMIDDDNNELNVNFNYYKEFI